MDVMDGLRGLALRHPRLRPVIEMPIGIRPTHAPVRERNQGVDIVHTLISLPPKRSTEDRTPQRGVRCFFVLTDWLPAQQIFGVLRSDYDRPWGRCARRATIAPSVFRTSTILVSGNAAANKCYVVLAPPSPQISRLKGRRAFEQTTCTARVGHPATSDHQSAIGNP